MHPIVPRVLGLGGLIPFIILSLITVLNFMDWGQRSAGALMVYAALILSFLGGVHWGAALKQEGGAFFLLSMLPFFVAWIALFLAPVVGLWLLITGFAAAFAIDRSMAASSLLPGWFLSLRTRLTGVAMASLLVAVLGL